MKAIPGKFQHELVIADKDKKKIRKVLRNTCTERQKISLLKDVKIRMPIEEKVIQLVDVEDQNLWVHFKDWILKACYEVSGKKRGEEGKEVHGG